MAKYFLACLCTAVIFAGSGEAWNSASRRGTIYNDQVAQQLQTTNGIQANMSGYTLLNNTSGHFRSRVVGRNDSNGDSKVFDIVAAVKRHNGGDAQIVGSPINLITAQGDTSTLLWSANITASGTSIRVSVTGADATTVEWAATMNVMSYDP